MVQPVVDFRPGARHAQSRVVSEHQRACRAVDNCRSAIIPCSIFPIASKRRISTRVARAVFPRLAGPSHLRRVLEADGRSKSTSPTSTCPYSRRRLVRHFPRWIAAQLYRHQGARRQRSRTQRPASVRHHRRPRRDGRKIGDVDFGPAPPSSTKTALTSSGTTTCSRACRTNSPRQAGTRFSSWAQTSGGTKTTGRWPARKSTKYFLHSQRKRELAARRRHVSPPRHRDRRSADHYVYDPRTPCPPSAARSAAIRTTCARSSRPARRRSPRRRLDLHHASLRPRTPKSPVRSGSISLPSPRPSTPTSPPSWWMSGRTDSRRI